MRTQIKTSNGKIPLLEFFLAKNIVSKFESKTIESKVFQNIVNRSSYSENLI